MFGFNQFPFLFSFFMKSNHLKGGGKFCSLNDFFFLLLLYYFSYCVEAIFLLSLGLEANVFELHLFTGRFSFFFENQGGQLLNSPFIVTVYIGTFIFSKANSNGHLGL
jgi:hypothetical protein